MLPIALSVLATFAAASAVVVPAQSPQDGDTPALAEKAEEIVRQRLRGAGVDLVPLFPDAGATAKAPPPLALAQLKEGKDAYLQLRFDDAEEALKGASKELLRVLPQADVFDAFAEAEAYRAATALAEGKTSFAEAALMRVLLRRPLWVADTAIFPPDFAQAFRRAKARADALNRPRWEIVSEPALASVVIDGAPRGRTPLVVTDLPAGKHAVRVFAEGREVFAKDVLVRAEEPRLRVVLAEDPVAAALAAYVAEVRADGKKEAVRARLADLAKARGVDAAFALCLLPQPGAPYVATVARATPKLGLRRAASAIDPSFTNAPDALEGAVARLLDPSGPALSIPPAAQTRMNFRTHFFGRTLIPKAARQTVSVASTSTSGPPTSGATSEAEDGGAFPLLLGGGAIALGGVALVGAIAGGVTALYFYDQSRGVEVPPYEVKVGGGVAR